MNKNLPFNQSDFLLYTAANGKVKVEVFVQDETVWLTQKTMGQLFGVESHTITYHLKEIFKTGELNEVATTRKIRAVQSEGKRKVTRDLDFYNLDAIIAVGYRVNSYQATQFRIWATKTLKEFIIKGFVLDDERLVLKKLLNDEIKTRIKKNLIQGKSLMEMLENSIKKYHNKILTAAEVIEELIKLSKEIKEMDKEPKEMGLSDLEYAFYTAIANNDSARQLMKKDKLRELAVSYLKKYGKMHQ